MGVVVLIVSVVFGYIADRYIVIADSIVKDTETLEQKILELEDQNISLKTNLSKEQKKNSEFEGKIVEIAGTVDTLDKLAKIDKELLQKYSKVYFLNEHYVPTSLVSISEKYVYEKNVTKEIHGKVISKLNKMFNRAMEDGVDMKILSAYRSFDEQNKLKNSYTVTYGSGANKFSADQGYSEHQLGTTIDVTTEKMGPNFSKFKDTDAYRWLKENAYKYGFIISYPENNSYYEFEPWHWRFVGVSLATRLHEEGQYFYDLDQRTIDQYLISIFD
jgi:LAS superfamily LD-carboxypeptidase LdcB